MREILVLRLAVIRPVDEFFWELYEGLASSFQSQIDLLLHLLSSPIVFHVCA